MSHALSTHRAQTFQRQHLRTVPLVHHLRRIGDPLGEVSAARAAAADRQLVEVQARRACERRELVALVVGFQLAQDGQQGCLRLILAGH